MSVVLWVILWYILGVVGGLVVEYCEQRILKTSCRKTTIGELICISCLGGVFLSSV